MGNIKIHQQFKLDEHSFYNVDKFLKYIKQNYLDDYHFLKELFNDSQCIIVKTSGSTGTPKNIKLPKNSLLKSAEATGNFFSLTSKSKVLHCLSTDYIAGKMMWVRALHLGWHLTRSTVCSTPLTNNTTHFDFTAMVPLQAQSSYKNLENCSKIIIGGAPISHQWEKKFSKLNNKIYITYGMTETITHIAVKQIGVSSTFTTLPNINITQDYRNCLIIQAPNICPTPIITNDIVKIISQSKFKWIGRYDNIINTGGVKISPEKIEHKLEKFIKKPFVISYINDEKLGQKLALVIESKKMTDINLTQLISESQLTRFEQPKKIFFIDNLPRKNNKINRIDIFMKINK